MSPEGTWRDVDILFAQSKKDVANKIRIENPTPLSVGAVYHNIAEIKPNEAILKFGKNKVRVPTQAFTTQEVYIGGFTNFQIQKIPARADLIIFF